MDLEAPLPPMRNGNAMKLGIFCLNVSGGTTPTDITEEEGRLVPTWEQNVRIAQAVDEAGWEFLIPLGRWRAYNGPSNHQGLQFEVFTWAAGIAAVTSQIQVFATAHVPLMHPVMAAKQGATVDLIGGGRFGMNIVAGWNLEELALFGVDQLPHDERYAAASEWTELVERLWTEEDGWSFEGRYYSVGGAYLQPKPVQAPRPVLVNAGSSPAGMRFGAKHCDFSFQVMLDFEQLAKMNAEVRRLAAGNDREVGIVSAGLVSCADTEKEAQAYYDYFTDERGDWETVQDIIDSRIKGDTRSVSQEYLRGMGRAQIAGSGAVPLVGTPEQIVDKLIELKELGVDGLALSWFEYERGVQQFNEQILPLMVEAGLRS